MKGLGSGCGRLDRTTAPEDFCFGKNLRKVLNSFSTLCRKQKKLNSSHISPIKSERNVFVTNVHLGVSLGTLVLVRECVEATGL